MARLFVQFHVDNVGAFRVRRCRIAGFGFSGEIGVGGFNLVHNLGFAALAFLFFLRQDFVQDVLLLVVEQAQGAFAAFAAFATFAAFAAFAAFATFAFAVFPLFAF